MSDVLELPVPDIFHARRLADGNVETSGPHQLLVGRQVPTSQRQARPDGTWVQWTWRDGVLSVTNDRHGYLPLYYVADENEVCVSPSLIDVVRRTGRRAWNAPALGVFLRLGAFVGDETAFRDVRVLPANATLAWHPGSATITATPHVVHPMELDRDKAMDAFIDLVRASVCRRLPRDDEVAWMPISGGQDSRHMLFELLRAGVRPRCITGRSRPPGTPEDAEVAARVCAALGVEVEVVDTPEDWLESERRKNLLLGFTTAAHQWFLPLAEIMTSAGGVAYDGIGGEVLSAGYFIEPTLMADYEAGRCEKIARGFTRPSHEGYLSRMLSREALAAMPVEAAVARIAAELELHISMPIPINSYAMRTRQRRGTVITQYGFLRRLAAVFSPYMDLELYDFLSSLPWRTFADKKFHGEAIARAFPEFSHLPYAVRAGSTSRSAGREFRRFATQLLGYFASGGESRLVNRPYLSLVAARSIIGGQGLGTLPVLLLQLERNAAIEVS